MDTSLLVTLLSIVVLVSVGAFFAGSETALTAVSGGKMHQLEKDGSRAAANVNRLIGDRQRMIGALLLGNTFVNILASSLATSVLEDRLGHRAVAVVTVLMTLLILVFAEVLPKTLAIARTDRFALTVAGAVRRVVGVLWPIVGSVQFFVWKMLHLFGVKEEDVETAAEAHDEIRGTVFLRHQEGTVERESRDMISGVLDLRELKAGDVMIHRKTRLRSQSMSLPNRSSGVDGDASRARAGVAGRAREYRRRPQYQGHRARCARQSRVAERDQYRRAGYPALVRARNHGAGGTAGRFPRTALAFRPRRRRIRRDPGLGDSARTFSTRSSGASPTRTARWRRPGSARSRTAHILSTA